MRDHDILEIHRHVLVDLEGHRLVHALAREREAQMALTGAIGGQGGDDVISRQVLLLEEELNCGFALLGRRVRREHELLHRGDLDPAQTGFEFDGLHREGTEVESEDFLAQHSQPSPFSSPRFQQPRR